MLAVAGIAASHAVSHAESHAEPGTDAGGHTVTYTVVAQDTLNAQIYYLASEPASQADYDADASAYLTNVRTPLEPGQPWVYETTLTDPDQWALVSASGALRVPPNFSCEIAVDGEVVARHDGASGVQCALRPW